MDVVVLVLPIPVIMKLQMNRRSKLALLAVFTLGTLLVSTSILTLYHPSNIVKCLCY